jgi:DNA-binding response OmpR family regulator
MTLHMAEQASALVVEDEDLIRETLEALLVDEGFYVRVARNGAEALDILNHHWRPDVILLDLMMPQTDGWTFRARQREQPEFADVPIIVLSGAHEARARAREMGAAATLTKPFDLSEVVATVRRVIGELS